MMRILLSISLIALGIVFLLWGPWNLIDPAEQIDPPRPVPRNTDPGTPPDSEGSSPTNSLRA